MTDLFNGEISQNVGANQWLSSTTSAATQQEFCAASKSKYSEWHLSTHSHRGSQCVDQLWKIAGTAAFVLRCMAFIRCREHKPELKTQTQIRQDHQHHQLYFNQFKHCGSNLCSSRLLPSGTGKGVLESRVATRPHRASQGGEKQVCRRKPQTKHCQVASDFHVMLAGLPSPSS